MFNLKTKELYRTNWTERHTRNSSIHFEAVPELDFPGKTVKVFDLGR